MTTFFLAILGFLIARSLWDFVKVRAHERNQLPLVWLFQVLMLLALLALMLGIAGLACFYFISNA